MGTIGNRIRAARELQHMTQGDLAIRCGWGEDVIEGQSRISNYERGKREPTLDDLRKIAEVLKADPAELAFGHPLKPDAGEVKIIYAYRAADDRGKRFILKTCEATQPEQRQKKIRSARVAR